MPAVRMYMVPFKGSGDTRGGTKKLGSEQERGARGGLGETGIGAINRVIPWDSGTPHSLPIMG